MDRSPSPLRLLAKSYANELITRQQYVGIRGQLLKRLETKGRIDESDLSNFTAITTQGSDIPEAKKAYTSSDWIIIALGFAASAVLAFILYG